jgi:polysaccharide export outer membrane protein
MERLEHLPHSVGLMPTGLFKVINQPVVGLTFTLNLTGGAGNSPGVQYPMLVQAIWNQALLTAGGFKGSRTRRSTVDLIVLKIEGTVSKQQVPIDLAQGVNDRSNPILRENDIIVISRLGAARITDTLSLLLNLAARFLQCFRY